MYKWSHIIIVFILSTSIVTPSVISIWNDHYDIEISSDLGEDDTQKETKKELEEKNTFFETFVTPQLAAIEHIKCYNSSYSLGESSFTVDIHLPPPKNFI